MNFDWTKREYYCLHRWKFFETFDLKFQLDPVKLGGFGEETKNFGKLEN